MAAVTLFGALWIIFIMIQSPRGIREADWEIIGGGLLVLLVPALLFVPLLALRKRKANQRPTAFGLGLMGGVWLLLSGTNASEALTRHHNEWHWFTAGAYLVAAVGCYVQLYKLSKRIPKEVID